MIDDNAAIARAIIDTNFYMSATAEELTGDEVDAGVDVFARGSETAGLRVWTREDVQPPARHRLYRAVASEHFVLGEHDERVPVSPSLP